MNSTNVMAPGKDSPALGVCDGIEPSALDDSGLLNGLTLRASSSSSASETVGVLRRSEMELGRGPHVPLKRGQGRLVCRGFGVNGSEDVVDAGDEEENVCERNEGVRVRLCGDMKILR